MSNLLTNNQLRASKIIHRAPILHPLARFVSEEAIASMFNIPITSIKRIECYSYMVYVHGEHVSRFVSYADFPPMGMIAPPSIYDGWRWRRRWRKRWHRSTAPEWWQYFYIEQMGQSQSLDELCRWGELIEKVEIFLTLEARIKMHHFYSECEANFQEMMNVLG